jgi:ribosomal protein S18 acetylase RimI-like enzyme
MEIIWQKQPLSKAADEIYEIYKRAFVRDFDAKVDSVQAVINYLQKSECWLGYLDDKPICYFASQQDEDGRVELRTLGLLPDYQGKGIGDTILEKFLSEVRGKPTHLIVHPRNISAIILYLKKGWIVNGYETDFYGDGQPRILLERQPSN